MSHSANKLAEQVSAKLEEGYELAGGLTLSNTNIFIQAIWIPNQK